MNKTLSSIVAAATVGGVMAFAGPALANTNAPIAQTGGAEVVIPMMGSPLTVTVALDTTSGAITSVNLDPPTGFTATKVSPSRVRFEKGTDGTTRLNIRAKGDQLSVSVRSLKLDDLLGSGTWTGDVFGDAAASPSFRTRSARTPPVIRRSPLARLWRPYPSSPRLASRRREVSDDDDHDGVVGQPEREVHERRLHRAADDRGPR